MFKVIVDNKVVDLINDKIYYARVYEDGDYILCEEKSANAVVGLFNGIYQIKFHQANINNIKYPMCDILEISEDEFKNIYEQLSKNIVVVNEDNYQDNNLEESTEPQTVNLLNKITELESKLNELLNK